MNLHIIKIRMHFHQYQSGIFNMSFIENFGEWTSRSITIDTHGQENDLVSIEKNGKNQFRVEYMTSPTLMGHRKLLEQVIKMMDS